MPITNVKAFLAPDTTPQFVCIKTNKPRANPIMSIDKEIISDKISIRS